MNKTQLTATELQDRAYFIQTLAHHGWQGTATNAEFEQGEDFYLEAQMTAQGDELEFEADYSREYGQIVLGVETAEAKLYAAVKFEGTSGDVTDRLAPLPGETTAESLEQVFRELANAFPHRVYIGLDDDFELASPEVLTEVFARLNN